MLIWHRSQRDPQLVFGAQNTAAAFTPTASDFFEFEDIRLLGVITSEDTTDGFYGDTLIKSLLSSYVPELGQGVIDHDDVAAFRLSVMPATNCIRSSGMSVAVVLL